MLTTTLRPRNVNALRAGSLLYGDLGTSKAYVIGIAFAIAGYSSFWLILAVSILLILVGINYTVICRCYPKGGGVYTSLRQRSHILSIVAGFFLIADFIVTAAISAHSAFSYFQVEAPVIWTASAIGLIGIINYFGPRATGKQAFYVFLFTFLCLIFLAIFSIPHLGEAVRQLKPLPQGILENWKNFVSVIVGLSGVEVIASLTGVMKLDPGSTRDNPSVRKTANKAIFWVILEVSLFTSFFCLTSMALKGLTIVDDQVFSPEGVAIRDFWFRYLGETFVGNALGAHAGLIFGWIISIAFGILLFSAVNTAINGLFSLFYVISNDGEFPSAFQKLNKFGVPIYALALATIAPIFTIILFNDIVTLASLYAIGFIGAIATNLFATSIDKVLPINMGNRILMFFTFLIFFTVEITLFIDKPHARIYILFIVVIGLILRGLSKEARERRQIAVPSLPPSSGENYAILCCVQKIGKALDFAIQAAEKKNCSLYVLYIKEQGVISEVDAKRKWEDDPEAAEIFKYVKEQTNIKNLYLHYTVTDYLPNTIIHYAKAFQVNEIIVEMFTRNPVLDLMKGNIYKEVRQRVPQEMELLIVV